MARSARVVLICLLSAVWLWAASAVPDAPTTQPATKPATRPTTQPARVTFSVATYNINFGNANLRVVVETIRKADADLVCLQETTAPSRRYLTRHLGPVYRHREFRDGIRGEGFGFLAKTPIAHLKFLPRTFGYFGTWLCRVRLGGRDVQIANVHLQPLIPPRKAGIAELWKQFLRTERVRMKEIAAVHSRLPKDMPAIVAGDFNAPPMLASAGFLTDRDYTDSFAAVTKDAAKYYTWQWRWQGTLWRYRLDYIFHSKHIQTHTSRILPSPASDHFLVVSHLRWAPKGAAPKEKTPAPDIRP